MQQITINVGLFDKTFQCYEAVLDLIYLALPICCAKAICFTDSKLYFCSSRVKSYKLNRVKGCIVILHCTNTLQLAGNVQLADKFFTHMPSRKRHVDMLHRTALLQFVTNNWQAFWAVRKRWDITFYWTYTLKKIRPNNYVWIILCKFAQKSIRIVGKWLNAGFCFVWACI